MRTMINILPATYRRQQIIRNRAVQWSMIIGVALLTGWGWHWHEMQEHTYLSQQLDVLSREHTPTRTMLKQLVDPGGLLLTGVSLDNPAVAELLDGLQHSGIFSHVELLKLKEREGNDNSMRDYEVRCEF
jgi:hypothetical protein